MKSKSSLLTILSSAFLGMVALSLGLVFYNATLQRKVVQSQGEVERAVRLQEVTRSVVTDAAKLSVNDPQIRDLLARYQVTVTQKQPSK